MDIPRPKLTIQRFLQFRSFIQVQLNLRFDMAIPSRRFSVGPIEPRPLNSLFQYTQQKKICYCPTTTSAQPLCTRTSAGSPVTWLLTPIGRPPQESWPRFKGYFSPE